MCGLKKISGTQKNRTYIPTRSVSASGLVYTENYQAIIRRHALGLVLGEPVRRGAQTGPILKRLPVQTLVL